MGRKVIAQLVSAASVGLLVMACAASPAGPAPTGTVPAGTAPAAATATTAAGTPVSGGAVTIVRDQEPDKLAFQWSPLTVSQEVSMMILDPLVTYSEKAELVPVLLKELPTVENGGISRDGLTYTLRLRSGVKWHDGTPLTSKDVVFTLGIINDPKNGARQPVPAQSISATDDSTVVLKLASPNVGLLSKLSQVQPLPQHTLSGVTDWKTAEYFAKPIPGNGAFKFTQWQRGNFIALEKNPDYYRGKVNLDKIVYRVIPNDDARLAALRTGEADMSYYLIGAHVELARQLNSIKVYETPSLAAFFFIFNTRDPMLKDARVRQALNYALDRDGIVKNVIKGLGSTKWSPVPKASPAYVQPKTRYIFDVAKAKSLLDQAGWKETTPGGVREASGVAGVPNGTKLVFQVNNIQGQAERLQVVQVAQQQWKAIGAQVDINSVDVAGYVAANNSFKFQMSYGYLGISPEPVEMGFWWQVKVGPNWHGLDATWPEIDDIFAKAATTLDPAARQKIIADYQERAMELALDAFVYDRVYYDAANSKIQNFKPSPAGIPTWNAFEWWLQR